jgi:hypothetical protein
MEWEVGPGGQSTKAKRARYELSYASINWIRFEGRHAACAFDGLSAPWRGSPSFIGENRLLTIFSRPYTDTGGKKRGFCRLPRRREKIVS